MAKGGKKSQGFTAAEEELLQVRIKIMELSDSFPILGIQQIHFR